MISLLGLPDRMSLLKMALMIFFAFTSSAQRSSRVRPNANPSDVTYAELESLGARCHPRDTCSVLREADNITQSFCQCGRVCSKLDTCCLDSKFRYVRPDPEETPHKCVAEYRDKSVLYFMIDQCKKGWSGPAYIRDMCLGDAEKLSDPLLLIHVTQVRKRRTYKNVYCAACNDEPTSGLTFWHLRAYRDHGKKMSPEQLTGLRFNPRKKIDVGTSSYVTAEWELAEDEANSKIVELQLDVPASIASYVQRCRKMVSACASNWTDDVVRGKCGSYMAHVVIFDVPYLRYRNVHCAICNYRDLKDLQCAEVNPADPGERGKRPFSFGRLLDVSPSGGDKVGRKRKCGETQLFHPVKNVCVDLGGCFIGHVYRDGQCVRRSG